MLSLESAIATEHATWAGPCVDRVVFGEGGPAAISDQLNAWCLSHLGAVVAGAHFYRVSVGCVAGLILADGREVVVKGQTRSEAYLSAVQRITGHLANNAFPCPQPLAGPAALGRGVATAHTYIGVGSAADPHDGAVRRVMAETLARAVALMSPFVDEPALGPAWFTAVPLERLWPRPHSPELDFRATTAGAEWIDHLAAGALATRDRAEGETVVGHFDWRSEHMRFDAGRVVATFDWDSLHRERETVMVGAAAHAFTADWSADENWVQAPSVEELHAFVDDYAAARGASFKQNELHTIHASLVYALAYTARCQHARDPRERGGPDDFRPLLRDCGERLLRL